VDDVHRTLYKALWIKVVYSVVVKAVVIGVVALRCSVIL